MSERNDSAPDSARNPTRVTFADAARFLGVDLFTFYALVQREEIPTFLATWGEFLVSQQALNELVATKE